MFLKPVSTNINCCKRVKAIANHLPAKQIRRNMGPSLLPIYNCKRSPIPHTYSHVRSLVSQAITHSSNKPNTTNAFNSRSEISNLPSPTTAH